MAPYVKLAQAEMASGAIPSTSPVPEVQVVSQLAPGKRGPTGVAPRTNYSRVNAGSPEVPSASATEQKSLQPKYGSAMNGFAGRATLQELVNASYAGAISRTKLAAEAKRQMEHKDEKCCEKCGSAACEGKCSCKKCGKEKCACGMGGKYASAGVSSTYAEKLANALDYLADTFAKEAAPNAPPAHITEQVQAVGHGPGALEVTQATASTSLPDHKGQATPKNVVPMHPGEEKGKPQDLHATAMETNDHDGPGGKGTMPMKVASSLLAGNLARLGVKVAEDAINPAKIVAGPAVPPQVSASGEPGGEPAGGMPQGPTNALATNEAAINLTRGQAYANRKVDMQKWLTEPMDSAKHDNTLQVAFDNTAAAGPKVASVKTAASRALLEKLAESV